MKMHAEDTTACEILKQKNKKLTELMKKVQNKSTISNIQAVSTDYLENNDIEWECNPYLFVFNDRIYNLEKCDWVEPNRDDYMNISCGYNYCEPTKEQIDKLKKLVDTIFPLEDEKTLSL